MTVEARAHAAFVERFDEPPSLVVRSPGRVNLIGDHTDYSDGFVLPIAIDREIRIAARPRGDRRVHVWAELPAAWATFDLDDLSQRSDWSAYLEGVASVLGESHPDLMGFDGVVVSDLPSGASLSSSAALELATARTLIEIAGAEWDATAMALAAQRAENAWVGMQCGIMDQLICAAGIAGHALLIDCRTLERTPTPLPDSVRVVVLDTGTRRQLVDSLYNERRAACEEAALAFGVTALRDLDPAALAAGADLVSETVYRRARHALNENAATQAMAAALVEGNLLGAGALMNVSHASLAADFEVSTPALDAMAVAARTTDGCYGARMTGAGFGGAVVALVDSEAVARFVPAALDRYETMAGIAGSAIVVEATDGVSVVV